VTIHPATDATSSPRRRVGHIALGPAYFEDVS
jgi:hypothetical protein